MDFISDNWLPLLIIIIVALAFIGYLIYLVVTKGLRQTAIDAILEAEKHYNSTTRKGKIASSCRIYL